MRSVLLGLASLLLTLFLVACGDLPTNSPAADVAGAVPLRDCTLLPDGTIHCPDLSPDWGDECDESLQNCSGEDCMTSLPGGEIGETTVLACEGGDGGGPIGGGDADTGGSGGYGDSSGTGGDDYGTGPFAEGPLAWAICVLAVAGAGVSIDDVGDKFESWWQSEKNLRRAHEVVEDLLGLRESGYYVSENDMDMAYYKIDVAVEARDAAKDDVHDATGVSWLALGGAAVACGASVLIPSP
jgi:hypothetical protein